MMSPTDLAHLTMEERRDYDDMKSVEDRWYYTVKQVPAWTILCIATRALTTIATLRREIVELRQRIDAGRTAHNDDRVRADTLWRERDALRAQLATVTERARGLEEALRFYALYENWNQPSHAPGHSVMPANEDCGQIARAALAAQAKETT